MFKTPFEKYVFFLYTTSCFVFMTYRGEQGSKFMFLYTLITGMYLYINYPQLLSNRITDAG